MVMDNNNGLSEMMPARAAAALCNSARSISGNYLKAETLAVLELVRESANAGQGQLVINRVLDKVIRDRLQTLEYVVKIVSARGLETQSTTTIYWIPE